MELSIGELLMVALVIVVLFGPDKLPSIARDLGQGVRKMRGAMEDIKTEILKETNNPVSEIKREIQQVKKAAEENLNPLNDFYNNDPLAENSTATPEKPAVKPVDDENFSGPVSR